MGICKLLRCNGLKILVPKRWGVGGESRGRMRFSHLKRPLSLWEFNSEREGLWKKAHYRRHNINRTWNTKTLVHICTVCALTAARNDKLKLLQFAAHCSLFFFLSLLRENCVSLPVLRFWGLSYSARVSVRCLGVTGSKFWLQTTREKSKIGPLHLI